ncbi:hypothetical protein HOY80DRAFT_1098827 [Tuber brumale]|nr:hypothetical protein HOY80DRAFT_1098827 [Tuber brumale]
MNFYWPIIGSKTVIGIAFGNITGPTAHTAPDGKALVIANQEEDGQIPSVLSWVGSEEYHGTQEKSHLVLNAKNMVACSREFLVKKSSEVNPTTSHRSGHPMNTDGVPPFNPQQADGETAPTVSINEITKSTFSALECPRRTFLGPRLLCLLPRLRLGRLSCPCICCWEETLDEQGVDKNILVANLGGTRCDAAVVASRDGMYSIFATAHSYGLGRLKLAEGLVDDFSKEFIKKHKVGPGNQAERAKRTLLLSTPATISIQSLPDGYDFHLTVNRLSYELSAKVLDQVLLLMENVVKRAELAALDIGEIILAGVASYTPKIASFIGAFFPDSVPVNGLAALTTALSPSELSADSTAIQASLIAEVGKVHIEQSTHTAVSPAPCPLHPIGVRMSEDNSLLTLLEPRTTDHAWRIAQSDLHSDGSREIMDEKVARKVSVIAQTAIKGTTERGKVKVTINVSSDPESVLDPNVAVRAVSTEIGVKEGCCFCNPVIDCVELEID